MALLFPSTLLAGQIYGSLTAGGKGVAGAAVEIDCGGAITRGSTAPDGTYRIDVRQEGQCTFTLPDYAGRPSAVIFSKPEPSLYHFELVSRPDRTYELRRR
jgi:hypothetical protein